MSSKTAPIIIVSKQQDASNSAQAFDIPFSPPAPDDNFYFSRFLYANVKPKDEVDVNANYNETTSIIQPLPPQQQVANKNNLLRISLLKKSIIDSISPSPTPSSSTSNDGSDSQESSETNTPSTSPFLQRKQIQQQETIQPKQASEFVNKMFQTAFQTNQQQPQQQQQHHHHHKKCEQIKTFRELNSMVPDSL